MKTSTDLAATKRAPHHFAPRAKGLRVLARRVAPALGAASLLLLAGCAAMQPIPPIAAPPPVKKPPTGVVFSAEDNLTPGTKMEGEYRVRDIISAELLTIEGVTRSGAGSLRGSGVLQTIRVAGIVAPAPGQRGWQGSVKAVRDWTVFNRLNPTVELEVDPKYPIDLDGRAMMQVYFKGTAERTKDTRFNLNRMLVRSGWAVVDLNAATSIDLQQWLNDEEYARSRKLGLRKYGIILGQRLPSPSGKTAGASIHVMPGQIAPGQATTGGTSTTTTTTKRTTTVSRAAMSSGRPLPASSAMPPGAPGAPRAMGNPASSMGGNAARP